MLPILEVTLAVVIFVLLIACSNVSNLLMVRSFARQHEMTVRIAIGARKGRLVQQLLTEGLVIAAAAAANASASGRNPASPSTAHVTRFSTARNGTPIAVRRRLN